MLGRVKRWVLNKLGMGRWSRIGFTITPHWEHKGNPGVASRCLNIVVVFERAMRRRMIRTQPLHEEPWEEVGWLVRDRVGARLWQRHWMRRVVFREVNDTDR